MDLKNQINVLPLFSILDNLLIELLESLSIEEWHTQTIAKLWKVKDVASHLLDGNLRTLSSARDGYVGVNNTAINNYHELVDYLNELNLSWTSATQRLSPQILMSLLKSTGIEFINYLHSLHPHEDAIYPVAWAGHTSSPNWFHIAREYTEKFLHQQQIRDAVNKPGIMTKELFYPFIDILIHALPHTFRNVTNVENTKVNIHIATEIGGHWQLISRNDRWNLHRGQASNPDTLVTIHPDLAWKLFSKSWRPQQIINDVEIIGNRDLGLQVLEMVSFMA